MTPKETGDILTFLTFAIGGHQVTDPEMVIHLYADISQPLGER